MIYLSQFIFPSVGTEESFLHGIKETCGETWEGTVYYAL